MESYDIQSVKKHAQFCIKPLPVTGILVSLLCCGLLLPEVALSMQSGNTEGVASVTLSVENDDNVRLSSDTPGDVEVVDEMVYHVVPEIDLTHSFNDHAFKFALTGDAREGGGDEVESGINVDASVGLDLNFVGGLSVSLTDTYTNDEFDMALYDESGVAENRSNEYGVEAAYSFGERLRAEAGYKHLWQEYDNEPEATEYDTDTVNGKLILPVSELWKAYVAGSLETTESDQATIQNSDETSGVIGARWEGPARFSYWIEAGAGEIDYEAESEEDFSEAIGEAGVEVIFTPRSFMELAVGQNSYGELKARGLFSHNYADKLMLHLSANKSTAKSYSSSSDDGVYDVTLFRLSLDTGFLERFEAGVVGSYQIQDTEVSVETLIGKVTLDYPIQDWIKVGTHYQYSSRTSDNAAEEYDDNRIGIFATFSI